RAYRCCGETALVVVEAQPTGERQTLHRPPVLRVDAQIRIHLRRGYVRQRVLRNCGGDPFVERVPPVWARIELSATIPTTRILEANLERMRAGDIRHGGPHAFKVGFENASSWNGGAQ